MTTRSKSLITSALLTAATLAATPSAKAAGLLIAKGPMGTSQLSIKSHDVKVTINNGIAVTHVKQVFLNNEDRQVEALYTFPVPKGASVSNFSMWINGKEMTGEVIEKKRAREIFDSYKEAKRDPGLLEQTDFRTFEMRIFPIAPRAEQRVEVTYCQQLDFDHDWATYTYPLASNTQNGSILANGQSAEKFSLTVDAKSAIPIKEMTSPSHPKDFAIAKHGEEYQQASLEVTGGDLRKDVILAYHTARPHTGIDIVTSKQGKEDGYFYLTLTAGEELAPAVSGMDYVFVLDVSGSMNDDGKLEQSRKSLAAFIAALGPDDRFEVIAFNNQPRPLFGELQTASDETKKKGTAFLESQPARGGTILAPAMTAAYKYGTPKDSAGKDTRSLNVVLMSDGLTETGESATLAKLIKERPASSRVFCIGVGNDVNRALLEEIANNSGGLAAFLSRDDDFTRQASAFRRKLLRPAATNLKIDIDGADVYDVEPQKLPNLYHGMPVRIYGRYKNAGNATVNISADIAGKPLAQKLTVDLPRDDDANPEIERMWAWNRIDRLQKESDGSGSGRQTVIPEIIRLGEGYSIVTEYTSFLVLENDGEFQRWKIDRKNALRVQRDRASEAKVAEQLAKLRERSQDTTVAAADDRATTLTSLPKAAAPQQTRSQPLASNPTPTLNTTPNRSQDVTFNNGGGSNTGSPSSGGGGHGGAIDPVSALALVGLGALGIFAKGRGRRETAQ